MKKEKKGHVCTAKIPNATFATYNDKGECIVKNCRLGWTPNVGGKECIKKEEKVKNDKNAAVDFNKNKPTNTAGKTIIGEDISQKILNDAKDRQKKLQTAYELSKPNML